MSPSDSEDEGLEEFDLELDEEGDVDADADADNISVAADADDATEDADDDSNTDDSDDDDDEEEEEDDDSDEQQSQLRLQQELQESLDVVQSAPRPSTNRPPSSPTPSASSDSRSLSQAAPAAATTSPPPSVRRSPSPAQRRRTLLTAPIGLASYYPRPPRSYTVEAICAIPHPVPTHALASSLCMTHLLTGSDDGYIRDYDIFSAVNGKNFLTAPQRHHAGVVEGLMKSGQIKTWWENPAFGETAKRLAVGAGVYEQQHHTNHHPLMPIPPVQEEDHILAPVYSLAMHSDALWALAGTDTGHVNLFTVRHEPGKLIHVMNGHRGPVSALSIDVGEKGFFSAGWDGDAIQWDLNTGQMARNFIAHGAQLAAIAVRPANTVYSEASLPVVHRPSNTTSSNTQTQQQSTQSLPSQTQTQMNGTKTESNANTLPLSMNESNLDNNLSLVAETATTTVGGDETSGAPMDVDAKSDASFDPLFDDVPEEEEESGETPPLASVDSKLAVPSGAQSNPYSQAYLIAQRPQQQVKQQRPTHTAIPPPKNAPPLLDSAGYASYSTGLLMTAFIDGQVILWDRRVSSPGRGVGRLWMSEKTPPWCLSACWSADGGQIYAGRRNGTVDVWDVRLMGRSGPSNTPRLLKTLRNPTSSGVVSCVVPFPDCRHIACASIDNIRLWNVAESGEESMGRSRSGVPFKIIPGHHGGYISQMLIDPGARFMLTASSNRGWHGESTRTVFVHDIKPNF